MKYRGTRLPLTNTAGLLAAGLLLSALVGCNATDIDSNTDPDPTPSLTGEILVELQAEYTATHLDSLLDTLDVTRSGGFDGNIFRIAVPEGQEAQWLDVLRAKPIIRAADFNHFGHAYGVSERDSLPRLRGDSLFVEVAYGGCSPGHAFTLGVSRTGSTSFDVWLYKQHEEDCKAAFSEVRAFKVSDEVRDADTVRLVKPLDARITLAPAPTTPVYDFGDGYGMVESDSLPRLRGDSLHVEVTYMCGGGAFALEYFKTGDSAYEVWAKLLPGPRPACAMPYVHRLAFKVPDEIKNAKSVKLVTPPLERIELKD